jgi:penicillin-binding protein 2
MLGQGQTIQEFQHRFPRFFFIILVFFCCLALRLVYLQLWKGSFYRRFSDQNSLRREKLPGPRGLVFDRNYKLLVDNRLQLDVTITPQFVKDLDSVLEKLAVLSGSPPDRLQNRYKEKLKKNARFQPISILEDVPWSIVSKIESSKEGLAGVEIESHIRRTYLDGNIGAHVLGYLSEVNKKDIELNLRRGNDYELGDWIGRAGLAMLWSTRMDIDFRTRT